MNNYFRYLNQKCPICEKEFANNDDIVVCPLCGTPHHRDCYKKNGECGNFDEHNKGFRWTPVEDAPQQATEQTNIWQGQPFAPQPTSQPVPQAQFPPIFLNGAEQLYQEFPVELDDDILTVEAADFVQQNSKKYLRNFFCLKAKKNTFNWAAFLFAPYWFFYRKLYKFGAIFLAIGLLLNIGFSLLPPVQNYYNDLTEWTEKYQNMAELTEDEMMAAYNEQSEVFVKNVAGAGLVLLQGTLELAIQIFIGFKANKWYYDHTVQNMRKIKSETPDVNQRRLLFFKVGGASMGATFLAILAERIVIMVVEMLLTFI